MALATSLSTEKMSVSLRSKVSAQRCHRQAAFFSLSSWQGLSLFLFALGRVAAVAQPPRPIAAGVTDLLPSTLPPCLPKQVEPMRAQYPILFAALSSKEQLARKSADRYCPNRMAACS